MLVHHRNAINKPIHFVQALDPKNFDFSAMLQKIMEIIFLEIIEVKIRETL